MPTPVRARFLITSQRSLVLDGVDEFPLPALEHDAAVALFVRHAQLLKPDFSVDDRALKRVQRLVDRLQGVPLALAIAAARVEVLSLSKLEKRLAGRLEALTQPPALGHAEDALMGRLGEWVWELLPPWARAVLQQCAVFVGGFGLEQATA